MGARSGSGRGTAAGALEVAPLSYRVSAMSAFRVVLIGVLGLLTALHSEFSTADRNVALIYLGLSMSAWVTDPPSMPRSPPSWSRSACWPRSGPG